MLGQPENSWKASVTIELPLAAEENGIFFTAYDLRKIADSFGTLNVMPSDLKKFLGHDLAASTPAEIADLREIFQGIKDGKVTWVEVMQERTGEDVTPEGEGAPKSGIASIKDRLKAQAPPPPSTGDQPKAAGQVVRDAASATEAPKTDEATVRDFIEKTAGAPPATGCQHTGMTVPAGKTHVCQDCTLDVKGPWPPAKGQSQSRLGDL